ncbi:hypothetical protein ACOME3_006317 [Neoechinorhynchus agilis]
MLQALEKLKDLHGDLKLGNIMMVNFLGKPEQFKLIDFGLEVQLRNQESLYGYLQTSYYRAPEMIPWLHYRGTRGCEANVAISQMQTEERHWDFDDDCEFKIFNAIKEADGERANIAVSLEMLSSNAVLGNIMMVNFLGKHEQFKLIDFGLEVQLRNQESLYGYLKTSYYRAQEMIVSLPIAKSIDMKSLGCTIGELAVVRPMWQVLECKQRGSKSNLAVKILKYDIGDFDMDDCEFKIFNAIKEADGERANIAVSLEMFK